MWKSNHEAKVEYLGCSVGFEVVMWDFLGLYTGKSSHNSQRFEGQIENLLCTECDIVCCCWVIVTILVAANQIRHIWLRSCSFGAMSYLNKKHKIISLIKNWPFCKGDHVMSCLEWPQCLYMLVNTWYRKTVFDTALILIPLN